MTAFESGLEPRIVCEGDGFLAVYKPPRLHTAPLAGGGPSLADWVFSRRPDARFEGSTSRRPGPAAGPGQGRAGEGGLFHRLDYETSGLVLFALDPASLAGLLASQEAGLVVKTYRARSSVSLSPQEGARPGRGHPGGLAQAEWDAALGGAALAGAAGEGGELGLVASLGQGRSVECRFRPFGAGGARVACLDPGLDTPRRGGRRGHGSPEASYLTELIALCALPGSGGLVAIEARIRRGFRHQIRAQLAWIGLPLAGDALYGGAPAARLCLHAGSLSFPRPRGGGTVVVECPLDGEAAGPPAR